MKFEPQNGDRRLCILTDSWECNWLSAWWIEYSVNIRWYYYFFQKCLNWEWNKQTEKEKQRVKRSVSGCISQMATAASQGSCWFRSFFQVSDLGHLPLLFPGHWQWARAKVKQPGHELEPICDAGLAVSDFACYTATPAPLLCIIDTWKDLKQLGIFSN